MRYILPALLAAGLATGSASAQQKRVLKFAIFTPDTELSYRQAIKPFADRVNKDAEGTIEIQTFPNSALGRNPATQLKMVDDGVADFALVVQSYTPGVFKDDVVFELPNIVRGSAEGGKAGWRLYRRGLLSGYDRYYMIAILANPPYTFHMRMKIASMDDLKGKKIRTTGSIMIESVKLLGAAPEPMAFHQAVESISRGTLDGTIAHPPILSDFGVTKVVSHHYLARLGTVTLGLFMNQKVFDSLPPQGQAAIEKHRGEVVAQMHGGATDDRAAELIAQWKKDPQRTVIEPGGAESKRWDETLAPLIADFEKRHPNGKALVAALREELEKIRKGN